MVQAPGHPQPPREKNGQRDLVELGRSPVRRPIDEPVLKPTAVTALAGLEVPEGTPRRRLVAGVQKRGGDAAQIARPHEVIDMIAVVIALAPWRAGSGHESSGVRFVLEAAKHGQRSAWQQD